MADLVPYDPASPETFWLYKLISELLMRQQIYKRRKAYYDGDHPVPDGDPRYVRALKRMQKKARTNYISLITNSTVERMHVKAFRFGPEGNADPEAKAIWDYNDMDRQSDLIHLDAAIYGMGYALVSPPEEGSKYPVITREDPRICITWPDPVRPSRSVAALRMWYDDLEQRILAVVYLPDAFYGFIGPNLPDFHTYDAQRLREALLPSQAGASAFRVAGTLPNPTGVVPIVPYDWRNNGELCPEGECGEDLRDIQDRINMTILDRMVISRAQAYKQRWVTGLKIPKTVSNQAKPPFDPGADTLFVTENENAKFGEFTSADIRMILEAVRDDVADMASISKTPAHYLMGRIANVSGDTLTQAETGLVSKSKIRMNSMGWSHEQVLKVCFYYLGDTTRAEDIEAQTLWFNPEQQTFAEQADGAQKLVTAGIPLQLVMERLDFSPDEIEFAIKERERLEQKQMEQQQQLAQQQIDSAKANKASAQNKPKPSGKASK